MAFDDLREFIRALEKHGELKRIPFEVDPHLEITEFADRISELLAMQKPEGLLGKLKMLPKLADLASVFPKTVSSGPCKDVIRHKGKFDLSYLPVLHCWP